MATLFELSTNDLYHLAISLMPVHKEGLDPGDITMLRTRVTEWLLLNGFSTLHRFSKSTDDEGGWTIPRNYSCDSCRRKREEHKYTPKVKEGTSETSKLPEDVTILSGDEFITFDVKEAGKTDEGLASQNKSIADRESISLRYYSSAKECLSAFIDCILLPFRACFCIPKSG